MIRLMDEDYLFVVIAAGGNTVYTVVNYLDRIPANYGPGNAFRWTITGSGSIEICPGPGTDITRDIDTISLFNVGDDTGDIDLVVAVNAGTGFPIWQGIIPAGGTLYYSHADNWELYDADGVLMSGLTGPQGEQGEQGEPGADGTGATEATQAEMETATGSTQMVTPRRVQHHPGVAKGWVNYDQITPAIRASYNVNSVTDTGTGNATINWDIDFSSGNHCSVGSAGTAGGLAGNYGDRQLSCYDNAAGTTKVISGQTATGSVFDADYITVACFGDQ